MLCDLDEAVHVRFRESKWSVPVLGASAGRSAGVEQVLEAIAAHRAHVEAQGLAAARLSKRAQQVRHAVDEGLDEALWGARGFSGRVERELARGRSPHEVAATLLSEVMGSVAAPNEVVR
jgi:putative protein kinase ArgK-like GTPase of G3E family